MTDSQRKRLFSFLFSFFFITFAKNNGKPVSWENSQVFDFDRIKNLFSNSYYYLG